YLHIKRRCSDTDNDPDRCSVAVWSLESCHTDSSPATKMPVTRVNIGMVTRVNIGLLSAALRLVTRCLPWLPVKTSLDRCHTRRSSDVRGRSSYEIKFWTFFSDQRSPSRGLIITIGIHTGEVVTGVIGQRMPRYCLFGNTVNLTSRTETTGEKGKINVSEYTYRCLMSPENGDPQFNLQYRGPVSMKGKTDPMQVWFLSRKTAEMEHQFQAKSRRFPLPYFTVANGDILLCCRGRFLETKLPSRAGFHETRLSQKSGRVKSADYDVKSGSTETRKPMQVNGAA
ncbi:unnamed protein product, partial [Ranitomeya imitator]